MESLRIATIIGISIVFSACSTKNELKLSCDVVKQPQNTKEIRMYIFVNKTWAGAKCRFSDDSILCTDNTETDFNQLEINRKTGVIKHKFRTASESGVFLGKCEKITKSKF